MIRVEWIRSLEEIEHIQEPWMALERTTSQRTLYCRYDYIIPWYRTFAETPVTDHGRPLVGVVRKGGQVQAVAPLIESRATFSKVPVHRVDCAGYNLSAGEILIRDGAHGPLEALVDSLLHELKVELVQLHGLSLDSSQFAALQTHLTREGLRADYMEWHWYAVADLRGGYETYARGRTSNFRKQTRKIARRLRSGADVCIDTLTSLDDASHARRMRDRLFTLNGKSWRVGRSASERHPNDQPFYQELLDRFGREGAIDLAILTINGEDAAFTLGLIERGIYYHTMLAYDARFREWSPGTFLLQEVFRSLPGRGVDTVFSHGPYDYKRRWASYVVPQYTVCVFGQEFRARLARLVGRRLLRRGRAQTADRGDGVSGA